jgi:hypothetical protein
MAFSTTAYSGGRGNFNISHVILLKDGLCRDLGYVGYYLY